MFIFGDLIYALDQYSPSGFSIILLLLMPAVLIFYTLGWKSNNPKVKKEQKIPANYNDKKETVKIKGVGGWLSLFLFGLFVSIIINFITGISNISSMLETTRLTNIWLYSLVFLDVLYFGGIIAFIIYTIFAFSKLKENAVSLGKMYLIIFFSTKKHGSYLFSAMMTIVEM